MSDQCPREKDTWVLVGKPMVGATQDLGEEQLLCLLFPAESFSLLSLPGARASLAVWGSFSFIYLSNTLRAELIKCEASLWGSVPILLGKMHSCILLLEKYLLKAWLQLG